MTREYYLSCRNSNNPAFLYEYYKENTKETEPMDIGSFFAVFQLWPLHKEVYINLLAYFDCYFELTKLENLQTNEVIKYY